MKALFIVLTVFTFLQASAQQQKKSVDTAPYGHNQAAGYYLKNRGFNMY